MIHSQSMHHHPLECSRECIVNNAANSAGKRERERESTVDDVMQLC